MSLVATGTVRVVLVQEDSEERRHYCSVSIIGQPRGQSVRIELPQAFQHHGCICGVVRHDGRIVIIGQKDRWNDCSNQRSGAYARYETSSD